MILYKVSSPLLFVILFFDKHIKQFDSTVTHFRNAMSSKCFLLLSQKTVSDIPLSPSIQQKAQSKNIAITVILRPKQNEDEQFMLITNVLCPKAGNTYKILQQTNTHQLLNALHSICKKHDGKKLKYCLY